jgi:hypothetical protein
MFFIKNAEGDPLFCAYAYETADNHRNTLEAKLGASYYVYHKVPADYTPAERELVFANNQRLTARMFAAMRH